MLRMFAHTQRNTCMRRRAEYIPEEFSSTFPTLIDPKITYSGLLRTTDKFSSSLPLNPEGFQEGTSHVTPATTV
ncbi:hypothetical protein DPMN_171029 [Dreissena polymorpha]|uniref:Uncharacterized protein n=1 Tax=Dreissena polymorpha TaxID=45954 RepID=A0A9D4E0I1_DREPO|nr:hypothetical protein DPMN_171029 [Dreissena polymorpha]